MLWSDVDINSAECSAHSSALASKRGERREEAFKQQTFSLINTVGIFQHSTVGGIKVSWETFPKRVYSELERGEGGEGRELS